jgi:sulfur transfer protein SufE
MADSPTIEDLDRRLDKLCDEYLKHPHDKYMQREIIELASRLDELKEGKRKVNEAPWA